MGRKNSFQPETIKNDKSFVKLKNHDQIIWKTDHDEAMAELFEILKGEELSSILAESGTFDIEACKNYKLIGIVEINDKLRIVAEREYRDFLYLIADPDYKEIFIAVEKCNPAFWYHYTSRKAFFDNFDSVVDTYNKTSYDLNHPCRIRGFIGTETMLSLTCDDIENILILGSHTEILSWGSYWKDHPFRDIYMDRPVTKEEGLQIGRQAMKQVNDEVHTTSIRTAFSKSIMTIEDHNGAFIMDVQYYPCDTSQISNINSSLDREYPHNLPVDVIISCINFPFVTHCGLLKLRPINTYNIIMASFVANNSKMCVEMIPLLQKLVNEEAEKQDDRKETAVVEFAQNFLNELETKTALDKILSDESVENFIGQKIINLRSRSQTYPDIRNEVCKMLDSKLAQLELRGDEEFKNHIAQVIDRLLKFA